MTNSLFTGREHGDGAPDVVAVGPNPWTGPWMNRQQLLSRLATRGWSVVYTTGPLQLWQRRSETWREAPWFPLLRSDHGVSYCVPGRFPPASERYRFLKFVSLTTYASLIQSKSGSPRKRFLYFFGPYWLDFLNYIEHDFVIYHAYDSFNSGAHSPYETRVQDDELKMLDRADLVIASSEPIAEKLRARGRVDVHTVPNGADFERFSDFSQPEPSEVRGIPRPRLGYIGQINAKLDLQLVDEIAAARPEWHWVLVGRVQEAAVCRNGHADALTRLYTRPNVHFLGHKSHACLPSYAHAMDVLTMVYRSESDGWWQAGYPLKMHDYLATGKPVISTRLPTIEPFAQVIDIRTGVRDWDDGIRSALNTDGTSTVNARQAVAAANSWDARVDQLESYLRSLSSTF